MPDTGLIVPGMHEPLSRHNVTITVARGDGRLSGPVSFAAAADRAAWRRSASIVSACSADQISSVITVHAPGRPAAVAVARTVVSDALTHQVTTPGQHAGEAHRGAAAGQEARIGSLRLIHTGQQGLSSPLRVD